MPNFLIVTADDFGLHAAVNEAVEQAHRGGILTAASLMVSADCIWCWPMDWRPWSRI